MLSRAVEKRETPKIQAGANPRETLEGRLRDHFNLPLDSTFESERGEGIDMSVFDGKAHVPNTRAFSHVKFFNPKTGRTSNIYSCDYEYCGMYFDEYLRHLEQKSPRPVQFPQGLLLWSHWSL
jgi:hypothetical protein